MWTAVKVQRELYLVMRCSRALSMSAYHLYSFSEEPFFSVPPLKLVSEWLLTYFWMIMWWCSYVGVLIRCNDGHCLELLWLLIDVSSSVLNAVFVETQRGALLISLIRIKGGAPREWIIPVAFCCPFFLLCLLPDEFYELWRTGITSSFVLESFSCVIWSSYFLAACFDMKFTSNVYLRTS